MTAVGVEDLISKETIKDIKPVEVNRLSKERSAGTPALRKSEKTKMVYYQMVDLQSLLQPGAWLR